MTDTVSVVIITYKRDPEILKRALKSVVDQTSDDIGEILIVDDNPDDLKLKDELIGELKAMSDKVRYITYEGNHGACYARNYGAAHSEGRLLAFMDDDDEWRPEKIDAQKRFLETSGCVAAGCNAEVQYINSLGELSLKYPIVRPGRDDLAFQEILMGNNDIGGGSYMMIRHDVFDEVGGFCEGLRSCQDYDLWLRLSEKGRIGRVEDILVNYYAYEGEHITGNPDNVIQGREYMLSTYTDRADDPRRFKAMQYMSMGENVINHRLMQGTGFLLKSLRLDFSSSTIKKAAGFMRPGIFYALRRFKRKIFS